MKIPISVLPVTVGPGETPRFRMVAKNPRNLSPEEILRRLSAKNGMELSTNRYWMDSLGTVVYEALAANETVDCGFVYGKLYPTGTLPSLTAQPTKEANPVRGRIFFKGEMARRLAEIELVNETQSVDVIIYELQQDGVAAPNCIESTTARIVLNVNRGKVVSEQSDNGLWLEDLKTNVKVADGVVIYSDSSTCHVTFPTLPPTGTYRLVLATRDGESPEEYVLARATRNVIVRNGEVNHG